MKRLIFAAICLVASYSSFADSVECDNCVYLQMRAQALDLGNGSHYFWDYAENQLTHLAVSGITVPQIVRGKLQPASVGAANPTVITVAITSGEQDLFNSARTVWQQNGGNSIVVANTSLTISLASVTTSSRLSGAAVSTASLGGGGGVRPLTDENGNITAFDTLQNQQAMDAAINGVMNYNSNDPLAVFSSSIRIALAEFVNESTSVVSTKATIVLRDIINFPDGSSIVVDYDTTSHTYKYEVGSARDGAGNPIPTSPQTAVGGPNSSYYQYTYPSTPQGLYAGGEAVDNLNRIGIATRFPSGVQINNGYTIGCAYGGGVYSCTIVPLPG